MRIKQNPRAASGMGIFTMRNAEYVVAVRRTALCK